MKTKIGIKIEIGNISARMKETASGEHGIWRETELAVFYFWRNFLDQMTSLLIFINCNF